jgi:hypothetical protein
MSPRFTFTVGGVCLNSLGPNLCRCENRQSIFSTRQLQKKKEIREYVSDLPIWAIEGFDSFVLRLTHFPFSSLLCY